MTNQRNKEEIITDIKKVLEDKVAPSVAAHNGNIEFISFDESIGQVKVLMAGSCSGCAMSQLTLRNGVEGMLKHYVPEVNSIIGEDDDKAEEEGYTPFYNAYNPALTKDDK
tara:strand:- start:7518 stop:7850 length:333 start_codon:yes stop_codon:yes gene_type:complete